VADVRAYPRLRSFPSFLCSVNFQDGILFLTSFLMLLKKIGRVFGVGRCWWCPKFLPPIPIAGFLFFWYKRGKCFGSIWTLLQYFITFESNSCYFHCWRFVGGHKSSSQPDGSSVGLVWLERRHVEWCFYDGSILSSIVYLW